LTVYHNTGHKLNHRIVFIRVNQISICGKIKAPLLAAHLRLSREMQLVSILLGLDKSGQRLDGVFISAADLSPDILHALRAE